MKIYIVEDDLSVINVLENIIEDEELGVVCGTSEQQAFEKENILIANPDIILIDLLMPVVDGIQAVKILKEAGCTAKFIMISQVSSKEIIAKAYTAGIEFFISKPINYIEVCKVIKNVTENIVNQKKLSAIQSMFISGASSVTNNEDKIAKIIQNNLNNLGMGGEKGVKEIIEISIYLINNNLTISEIGLNTITEKLFPNPKATQQRIRRSIEKGLRHVASLGIEDFGNEQFIKYSSKLFHFEDVRAEMANIKGKDSKSAVNIKKFIDGLINITRESL